MSTDLDRTLSDLGLHNRQALIIVLRNKVDVTSLHGLNNPAESNHTTIGGDAGYFATIRKLFSYVNPLSYLGGSSNTSNTARDSIWQYGSFLSFLLDLCDSFTARELEIKDTFNRLYYLHFLRSAFELLEFFYKTCINRHFTPSCFC